MREGREGKKEGGCGVYEQAGGAIVFRRVSAIAFHL